MNQPDEDPRPTSHGRRRGSPRGAGRRGRPQADLPDTADAAAWLAGRLPGEWFVASPTVTVDREEIIVVGALPTVDLPDTGPDRDAATAGRVSRFREQTRSERMTIADEAHARYGRTLSWGVTLGDTKHLFTHLSTPVMTRLRQPERQVLDTLVDAGVARSRSDALGWAVRLVAENSEEWLSALRDAMSDVERIRNEGPTA
ncbi:MAG: hypothetical protein WAN48_06520 [Actinomycetes bacterium]